MNDKSHVSMEQRVCVVCCKEYDTGAILLDRRLKNSMDRCTITGWGMCPEHQEMKDKGYIALIAIDPDKSKGPLFTPSTVYRTGNAGHLSAEAFARVFDMPVPEDGVVFCSDGVLDILESMQKGAGRDG
jgi:hypothetical protein